jgi:hypothetical protein
MNSVAKCAMVMLLVVTISSNIIHLNDEYRLEFTDYNQCTILRGAGEGINRCLVYLTLCVQEGEDWELVLLHYCVGNFPQNFIITGARKNQEKQELIALSKTQLYAKHSTCEFENRQIEFQFLE